MLTLYLIAKQRLTLIPGSRSRARVPNLHKVVGMERGRNDVDVGDIDSEARRAVLPAARQDLLPELAIKRPIVYGLGDMAKLDIVRSLEVSDSASQLEDAIISPGREPLAFDSGAQE